MYHRMVEVSLSCFSTNLGRYYLTGGGWNGEMKSQDDYDVWFTFLMHNTVRDFKFNSFPVEHLDVTSVSFRQTYSGLSVQEGKKVVWVGVTKEFKVWIYRFTNSCRGKSVGFLWSLVVKVDLNRGRVSEVKKTQWSYLSSRSVKERVGTKG